MTYGKKNYNTCRLEDGRILNYDFCSSDRDGYNDIEYRLDYLGKGTHYTCNGVYQSGHDINHFWERKSRDGGLPVEQKNDLSSARVGDRLYHVRYGEGVVVSIYPISDYPIKIEFMSPQVSGWLDTCTLEGKVGLYDFLPSVFWSKPTIIPPPPPKRVVKKSGWVGFWRVKNGGLFTRETTCSTVHLFDSETEANRYADLDPSIPRAVYVEYEEVSDE